MNTQQCERLTVYSQSGDFRFGRTWVNGSGSGQAASPAESQRCWVAVETPLSCHCKLERERTSWYAPHFSFSEGLWLFLWILTDWYDILALPPAGRGEGAGGPRQYWGAGVAGIFSHLQKKKKKDLLFYSAYSHKPVMCLVRLTSRRGLTSPALWLRWRVRCWRWVRRLGGRLLCRGSRGSMKVVARQLWSTKKGCEIEATLTS